MELGGADAFIVLADADLDKTATWGVFGRHWNGGQVCVSSKRMIVVDQVYAGFLTRYRKGVSELVAGDPFDPKTTLAPLSSRGAADEIGDKIREAVKLGAKGRKSVGLFATGGLSCSRPFSPISQTTILLGTWILRARLDAVQG